MMIAEDGRVFNTKALYYWLDTTSNVVVMTLDSKPPKIKAFLSENSMHKMCYWMQLEELTLEIKND